MADRQRIVSLLPGATGIVCALGAGDWLVGVSHECDFPAELGEASRCYPSRAPIPIGSTGTICWPPILM